MMETNTYLHIRACQSNCEQGRKAGPLVTDMTGLVFGRLTVLGWAGSDKKRQATWSVRCECGTKKTVSGANLRSGVTRSCGCLESETRRTNVAKRRKTHGLTASSAFNIYQKMVQRCHNPNDKAYPHYGGRGIFVCTRWRESFENFFADMGHRPGSDVSLDRRDNDGPYSPENCRWADWLTQANNRRSTVLFEHDGRAQSRAQWAREIGMQESTLEKRLSAGWPFQRAITEPVRAGGLK